MGRLQATLATGPWYGLPRLKTPEIMGNVPVFTLVGAQLPNSLNTFSRSPLRCLSSERDQTFPSVKNNETKVIVFFTTPTCLSFKSVTVNASVQ